MTNITIWPDNRSDIIKEYSSFEVRVMVVFQGEIPAGTNTLPFEVLGKNLGILRSPYLMEK
jgi:hypothetical protein